MHAHLHRTRARLHYSKNALLTHLVTQTIECQLNRCWVVSEVIVDRNFVDCRGALKATLNAVKARHGLDRVAGFRRLLSQPQLEADGQEHGRSDEAGTARWQDRLNPLWCSLTGECNINRKIDQIVERSGFEMQSLDRFLGDGPKILTTLYRGVATRA